MKTIKKNRKPVIIIGIPSYNEADNISFVTEKCDIGIQKYFPTCQGLIINVDNNSADNTKDVFLKTKTSTRKKYITTAKGVTGKGNNFYNLFVEAQKYNTEAIIVVDADITSITPEWIRDLATPILNHKYDFVTPFYSRNEYDGTITNNICYPLLLGLLGKDIRQPIGGDFAFSKKLNNHFLNQKWHDTTYQYGIDIFMTLNAILGKFKTCQVSLGAKIHKPSAPKLGPMFTQVVSTMFNSLLNNKSLWKNELNLDEPVLYGNNVFTEPQSLSIDYKTMKKTTYSEFNKNKNILKNHLSPDIYSRIDKMFEKDRINISIKLWTHILYDLIYAYDNTSEKDVLVEAIKSLYFARVLSFYKQTLEKDHSSSEALIQKQAKHFFSQRASLINKYKKINVA